MPLRLISYVLTSVPKTEPTHLTFNGKQFVFHSWHDESLEYVNKQGKTIRRLTGLVSASKGICYDGKNYFFLGRGPSYIHTIDPDGNVLRSVSLPQDEYDDIEFDGKNFLIVSDYLKRWHYYDREGNLLKAATLAYIKPEALCFDGKTYWVIDTTNRHIARIAPDGTELYRTEVTPFPGICFDGRYLYALVEGATYFYIQQLTIS